MNIYPPGTVRALLETDLITAPTRDALDARLAADTEDYAPRFFDSESFATLSAACLRLIPQPERFTDTAREIDRRLAEKMSDGWRYDAMPPDEDAYRRGLRGLNESARETYKADFATLGGEQQDVILRQVQRGRASGAAWRTLPSHRFFEELLAEVTEAYYSHPLAQEEIGYTGMADAHGWQHVSLNDLESWEPRARGVRGGAARSATSSEFRMRSDEKSNRVAPRLKMRSYGSNEIIDAVVIGTGAGGAPLLARLAQAGLRVVALEAGKFWSPAQDFATDERAQRTLFWNDERLSAGQDPLHFGNNNSGIGVGGSTLHYTAYTPRVQPDDLRLRTEFGVGQDWCLSYEDLETYYDELERFLGVSGPDPYPWGAARRAAYPLAPLPLNGAAQLMERACEKLG
ncbi:MAG: gluconate 2-dehydrogenase subunit 3 family protein, partial [Acidobacteriota bacterium]|nr:gluconate 2-dehydrogenase subunit 3 family protein [Acidobacteriota bacterium]